MGGTTFWCVSEGPTAQKAFKAAQAEARYQHGNGGYTGTIAEKGEYVIIPVPQGEDPETYAGLMLDNDDYRIEDKWGPAGCIKLAEGKYLFFGWASC